MKEEIKKEIEAKWLQLVTEVEKSEKPESSPQKIEYFGARVIRRRKGQTDLAIS